MTATFRPHPYQKRAIDHILSHPKCAIFLGLGMGKTVITLTALSHLLQAGEVRRVLVVAPLRVAQTTWKEESKKWGHLSHLRLSFAVGGEQVRKRAVAAETEITVINRENVPWLVQFLGKEWPFDCVVVDELSSFKSRKSRRFTALASRYGQIQRFIGLTATPASNGLEDLWAQFKLLDGGARLGRYISYFRDAFFVPDKRSRYQVFSYKIKPGGEEEIYRRISDITLSMKTDDYLVLPPVTTVDRMVPLRQSERKVYEGLVRSWVVEMGGQLQVSVTNAASLANKLLQLASGAVYTDRDVQQVSGRSVTFGDRSVVCVHDRKLDELSEVLESANGNPVLVAYWFEHDLQRIRARFPFARLLRSPEDFSDWNAGKIALGLIHPASAGHGLNLQYGGCVLVFFSMFWSLELYKQTVGRLYRQGQQLPVTVVRLVAEGTIDEDVVAALERKELTEDALIEAVSARMKGDMG